MMASVEQNGSFKASPGGPDISVPGKIQQVSAFLFSSNCTYRENVFPLQGLYSRRLRNWQMTDFRNCKDHNMQ